MKPTSKVTVIVVILLLVIISGGYLVSQMFNKTDKTVEADQNPISITKNQEETGQGRPPGGGNAQISGAPKPGGRPITGEVLNIDDDSLNITLDDGSTKIIILAESTVYKDQDQESDQSQIEIGDKIRVMGTENSDGTITARNIQLNPEYQMPEGSPPERP